MKPILFNTAMVRAILAGNKTVTRRVVKPQPRGHAALLTSNLLPETTEAGAGAVYAFEDGTVTSPPYRPGDILYVRETFHQTPDKKYWYKADNICVGNDGIHCRPKGVQYHTTCDLCEYYDGYHNIKWRPSIHMPREAARIFLLVTDVRVERLRDISMQGVRDEGVEYDTERPIASYGKFVELWDKTIKPDDISTYGWDANPWVWVISFERIRKDGALRCT